MAEWVDHSTLTKSVRLISNGKHLLRPGCDSPHRQAIGVFHVQVDADCRAIDGLRTQRAQLGALCGYADRTAIDHQHCHLRAIVRVNSIHLFHGAERFDVARDGDVHVFHGEKRPDTCHASTVPRTELQRPRPQQNAMRCMSEVRLGIRD